MHAPHRTHHLNLYPISTKHDLSISDIRFYSNNIHFTIAFAFLFSKVPHPVSPLISSFQTFPHPKDIYSFHSVPLPNHHIHSGTMIVLSICSLLYVQLEYSYSRC